MKTNEIQNRFPLAYSELAGYFAEYRLKLSGIDKIEEKQRLKLLNIFMGYSNVSDKNTQRMKLTVTERFTKFEEALQNHDPHDLDFMTSLARLSVKERFYLYPETMTMRMPKITDALHPIKRYAIKHSLVKLEILRSIKKCLVPRTDISYMERKAVQDAEMERFWQECIRFSWRKEPCPF